MSPGKETSMLKHGVGGKGDCHQKIPYSDSSLNKGHFDCRSKQGKRKRKRKKKIRELKDTIGSGKGNHTDEYTSILETDIMKNRKLT